jgi:hypothetical protein
MENVRTYIQNFAAFEFACNLAKYDLSVDDETYQTLRDNAQFFFHRTVPSLYGRGGTVQRLQQNIEEKPARAALYQKNISQTCKRTVFQIRHYKSPQVGDILREKMKTDELWGCLCSYHIDNGQDIDISRMYFVAETDEGLKIVYDWGFEQDKHTWRQTHDHLPSRIEHAGKLLEVLNLQPPVEPTSLQEYLHPTHTAIVIDN